MVQALTGERYEVQVRAAVGLIEVLARELGIARVVPWRNGRPELRVLVSVRATSSASKPRA